MGRFLLLFLGFVLIGCQETSISQEELKYLNGYWEISKVEFPDGTQKNYGVNPTIDFIKLEGTQGFRKKLQPKFNGAYQTSNNSELFDIVMINENFTLRYQNDLDEREEQLITIDSISFSVRNQAGILYSYKRFQPITIPK